MRVLVLGAGVIGTATAWYLARAGHTVTVVERQAGAGLETSFANGGQISPSHAEPWANPATPGKALRWLGHDDAPLLFRWNRWDPALWAWGIRFLRNCTTARAAINTERTLRVALHSRRCLQELRAGTGLSYDQRSQGILHVYRLRSEFEQACRTAELMGRHGLEREPLSPDSCVRIEPALNTVRGQLAGGIFTPGDESGDAHKFTTGLAALAAAQGVVFRYGVTVLGLQSRCGRIVSVETDQGKLDADAYVLACASYSPALLRPLGLRLPVIPAKGYSITVPVEAGHDAPTVSITDDEHKLVFSRLGERLRVAGTAEMAGLDPSLNQRRWQVVRHHAQSLFPNGGAWERAEPWAGLRPVTPDSVPVLGATPIGNLYLNTGHGTLGWTMACGSGQILADIISGRPTAISLDGLGLNRFA